MSVKSKKEKVENARPGFLLWQAGNAWQRHVRSELKPTGLTHVQFMLLEAIRQLNGQGKSVTQSAIAKVAGTDAMMTSKVLRSLEKRKLVARKENKLDARSLNLLLTAEGERKVMKAEAVLSKCESEFFARLKSKPHKFVVNLIALLSE